MPRSLTAPAREFGLDAMSKLVAFMRYSQTALEGQLSC